MTNSKARYLSRAMRCACVFAALATLSCGSTPDKVAPESTGVESRPLRAPTSEPQSRPEAPQQTPGAASPAQSPEAASTTQSTEAPAQQPIEAASTKQSPDAPSMKQSLDATPAKRSPEAVTATQPSAAAAQNQAPDAAKPSKGIAFSKKRSDALSAAARGQELDRIVAVVNDEVLTQFELNDRINLIVQQLNKQGTAVPEREAESSVSKISYGRADQ